MALQRRAVKEEIDCPDFSELIVQLSEKCTEKLPEEFGENLELDGRIEDLIIGTGKMAEFRPAGEDSSPRRVKVLRDRASEIIVKYAQELGLEKRNFSKKYNSRRDPKQYNLILAVPNTDFGIIGVLIDIFNSFELERPLNMRIIWAYLNIPQ